MKRGLAKAPLLIVAGSLLVTCARALPPPGGTPDRIPPRIIGTTPEPLSIVPEMGEWVVFHFNERISEKEAKRSILVSPSTGDAVVEKGRDELRVKLEGGWKKDQVYSVILLPGLQDLFGNAREAPAELVFSTGPPLPSTALAGLVRDRITGKPASDVAVEAARRPAADSVVYTTVGDSAAFFVLQHLPVGQYDVVAYQDGNGNRERDPSEPHSRGTVVTFTTAHDTSNLVLELVPADTTPPRLVQADARDSMEVHLGFDDYLEPDVPVQSIQASLYSLPDTTPLPGKPELMRADVFQARRRARADSVRADSLQADSLRADTTQRPAAAPAAAEQDTTLNLPYRELVLVPAAPLAPGSDYLVRVDNARNISGRGGGGGSASFNVPKPTPPAPDTTVVPPDTGRVVLPDTVRQRTSGR